MTSPIPSSYLSLSALEFDHSRSLKDNSNGAVGITIYDFLLVSNSVCSPVIQPNITFTKLAIN